MVSIVFPLIATAAVVLLPRPSHGLSIGYGPGDYLYRLNASGWPNAPASATLRGMCPVLNMLCNHGWLARDGRNISKTAIADALKTHFVLADDLIAELLSNVTDIVSLNEIIATHDASVIRPQRFYGFNPALVDMTLVEDLLVFSKGEYLDAESVGKGYRSRIARLMGDPSAPLTNQQRNSVYIFGATIALVLGGNRPEGISKAEVRSIFIQERFPDHWAPPASPITSKQLAEATNAVRKAAE